MKERGFSAYHPLPCFLYYIGVIILTMLINHPIFLLTALAMIIAINIMQDKGKSLKEFLSYYIVMALFIVVINPIVSHRGSTILFYFLDNPVTLEALIYGIIMSLSLLIVICAFLSYNMVICADKLMYLFSRLIPQITFIIMLAVRFVPLLKKRIDDINMVQKSRRHSISKLIFKQRIIERMKVLNTLVSWTLEEALETSQSMRARGYGVIKKRTYYFRYKMEKKDYLLIILLILLFLLSFSFWYFRILDYQIYPEVNSLNFDMKTIISYFIFIMYMGIPIFTEGIDFLRWH
jgi:energy-coupling factor transport system permease protein